MISPIANSTPCDIGNLEEVSVIPMPSSDVRSSDVWSSVQNSVYRTNDNYALHVRVENLECLVQGIIDRLDAQNYESLEEKYGDFA